MAKYINPGYGQLIKAGSEPVVTHENSTYNPKFGVALSLPDEDWDSEEEYVNPSIPVTFSGNEIFIKFDMYIPTFNSHDEISANNFTCGENIMFFFPDPSGRFYIDTDNFGQAVGNGTNLKQGEINHIWIHYTGRRLTINVNDKIVIDEHSSYGEPVSSTVSFMVLATAPVSNLIISDEYVDLNEVIVQLDAAAVDTNMAKDGEQFKAVDSGAYVLQTPDVSNSRGLFGDSGRILGIAAIAAPAYTTGVDVTKLKCRTVEGKTITDYALQDLSSDTDAMLAEYLPVSSDMTVASLAGLKIGWVTA